MDPCGVIESTYHLVYEQMSLESPTSPTVWTLYQSQVRLSSRWINPASPRNSQYRGYHAYRISEISIIPLNLCILPYCHKWKGNTGLELIFVIVIMMSGWRGNGIVCGCRWWRIVIGLLYGNDKMSLFLLLLITDCHDRKSGKGCFKVKQKRCGVLYYANMFMFMYPQTF